MMTLIGEINLSVRQMSRINLVPLPPGAFSLRILNNKVEVESTEEIASEQKTQIMAALAGLSDEPTNQELDNQLIGECKIKADKDITLADVVRVLRLKKIL